jgi:hypothetical protein
MNKVLMTEMTSPEYALALKKVVPYNQGRSFRLYAYRAACIESGYIHRPQALKP